MLPGSSRYSSRNMLRQLVSRHSSGAQKFVHFDSLEGDALRNETKVHDLRVTLTSPRDDPQTESPGTKILCLDC